MVRVRNVAYWESTKMSRHVALCGIGAGYKIIGLIISRPPANTPIFSGGPNLSLHFLPLYLFSPSHSLPFPPLPPSP